MVRMTHRNVEVEAKWRADAREHERLRAVLRQAGASLLGTVREINRLLDSTDHPLRETRQVLRLRWIDGDRSILTLKGPATYREGIKSREEAELDVRDGDTMLRILSGIGFRVSVEYAKTRESWLLDGMTVALDTLEFGHFVEIEGTHDQIQRAAKLLCLDLNDAERRGYPSMMREYQAANRQPEDLQDPPSNRVQR